MGLKILHLSDLHLGIEQKQHKYMENYVSKIILAEMGNPDVILVTGDIFDAEKFVQDKYSCST